MKSTLRGRSNTKQQDQQQKRAEGQNCTCPCAVTQPAQRPKLLCDKEPAEAARLASLPFPPTQVLIFCPIDQAAGPPDRHYVCIEGDGEAYEKCNHTSPHYQLQEEWLTFHLESHALILGSDNLGPLSSLKVLNSALQRPMVGSAGFAAKKKREAGWRKAKR
jgi:hypothetical protein